jgi:hypothetical protein
MSESRFDPLGPFRQPEYTGENRCLPCTAINVVIAAAAAMLVGVVAPILGIGSFLLAMAVIALRGYLVPGTPVITARYLPESVHRVLGHDVPDAPEPADVDVETALKDADVVTECDDRDDLCLTDDYREMFRSELGALGSDYTRRDRLAESLSVDPEEICLEEVDDSLTVRIGDSPIGGWGSTAAFVADLANEMLLSASLHDWGSLSPRDRTRLLAALRSFIEECPDCGGEVRPDEDIVRSCCRDDVISVTTTCADCGAVVFEGTDAGSR